MEIDTLKELRAEVKRFSERLDAAERRLKKVSWAKYGCKETGALKRSALDLNLKLSKITR